MKKMKSVTIAVVVAVALGTIIVAAQMSHKGGINQHFAGLMNHHEQFIDHVSDKLKLTGAQKAQAREILADSKPRFEPLLKQLKETHKASADLGTGGIFDEKKSQEIAARQAEIVKQVLVEKDKTKAALFAVLTAEQREQAKQMMNDFVEKFYH